MVSIYAHGFFFLLGLIADGIMLVLEARRRHWKKEEVITITMAAFGAQMHGAFLDAIEQANYDIYSKPIKFSKARKLWLLVSYLPAYFAQKTSPIE